MCSGPSLLTAAQGCSWSSRSTEGPASVRSRADRLSTAREDGWTVSSARRCHGQRFGATAEQQRPNTRENQAPSGIRRRRQALRITTLCGLQNLHPRFKSGRRLHFSSVHSGVMGNRSAAHRGREPDGGAYLPLLRISRKTYTVGWRFRSHGEAGLGDCQARRPTSELNLAGAATGYPFNTHATGLRLLRVADCQYCGEKVAVDRLLAHIAKDHPRPAAGDMSPKLVRKPIR